MSLTAEILKEFEAQTTALELIPSSGGAFEVTLDDRLIYSKHAEGRFPATIEIKKLIREKLGGKTLAG